MKIYVYIIKYKHGKYIYSSNKNDVLKLSTELYESLSNNTKIFLDCKEKYERLYKTKG